MISQKSPFMLMILDGVGLGPENDFNAFKVARTPHIDSLMKNYPMSSLNASGEAVGLPEGLMGNSEVGHLNIGAGRIIYQDITLITKEIEEGKFKKNQNIIDLFETTKSKNSVLHLIGLFSNGGVHSSDKHIEGIIKNAISYGIKEIALHLILDGRDVPPKAGLDFFKKFKEKNNYIELKFSTVMGRFWAMDRDNRWDRIEKAFKAICLGESDFAPFESPELAIQDAYDKGETDEFINPRTIKGAPQIKTNDTLFCFNFRADRVREITMAFTQKDFISFDVSYRPSLSQYLCMTKYKDDFYLPVAYPPREIKKGLSEVVSEKGLSQLKIAETEKYPHVTFFFNGGIEKSFPGEERILIPSPREVKTYDKKPEMSAQELTEKVIEEIKKGEFELIVLNFANGDMVGHSGILDAAVKAMETIDICVQKISKEILSRNGEIIIIADHGNCEEMLDKNGEPHTAHTTNKVPVIFISKDDSIKKISEGSLCDIAPTILKRLKIEQSKYMSGKSLI